MKGAGLWTQKAEATRERGCDRGGGRCRQRGKSAPVEVAPPMKARSQERRQPAGGVQQQRRFRYAAAVISAGREGVHATGKGEDDAGRLVRIVAVAVRVSSVGIGCTEWRLADLLEKPERLSSLGVYPDMYDLDYSLFPVSSSNHVDYGCREAVMTS